MKKYPKAVTWYKQKLEKSLQVACCLRESGLPHTLTIDTVIMIGIDSGPPLPFAFCPEHNAYFGISADTNMDKMVLPMVLPLNDNSLAETIEEEEKHGK